MVNRLGISKRPRRTGIYFLSTILIWPAAVIPGSERARIIVWIDGLLDQWIVARTTRDSCVPSFRFVHLLAGIKFYDGLLVGDGLDFIPGGDAHHDAFEGFLIQREPIGHRAAGGDLQIFGGQLPRGVGVLDFNDIVYLQSVGRDVDLAAIDFYMAVCGQLERDMISARTRDIMNSPEMRDTMRTRKKRGKAVGGPGLGFRFVGAPGRKVRVEDKSERATMGLIVQLRDAGMSWHQIASELMRRRIVTKRGRLWHPSRLQKAYQAELLLRAQGNGHAT